MSKLAVARELPEGRHKVRITLTPATLVKRSLLFERNRSDFDQHQDKYEDHTWYVSALLVIGKVLPNEAR